MADKILTWTCMSAGGNKYHIGPSYFLDADYTPTAVRIIAETAPDIEDAEFNIYNSSDGVTWTTIFNDRATPYFHASSGKVETDGAKTNVLLYKDENVEIDEDDFTEDLLLEAKTWVCCNCVKDGGGRNFTVHLELVKEEDADEKAD